MVTRDVELRIRASDKASKSLNEVAQALEELKTAQESIGQDSRQTSQFLDKLALSFEKLQTEIRDLDELAEVSKELDKISNALRKTQTSLSSNEASFSVLSQDLDQVTSSLKRLQNELSFINRDLDRQGATVKSARQDYSRLEKDVLKTEKAYNILRGRLKEAGRGNKELSQSVKEQGAALQQLRQLRDASQISLDRELSSLKSLQAERTRVNNELKKTTSEQNKVQNAIDKAAKSVDNQKSSVQTLSSQFDSLSSKAKQLASAVNITDISQENVAASFQRTAKEAANLTNVLRQQASLSSAPANIDTFSAEPTLDSIRKLNKEIQQAAEKSQQLQKRLQETEKPSKQLYVDFLKTRNVLGQLQGDLRSVLSGAQGSTAAQTLAQQVQQIQEVKTALSEARAEATRLGAEFSRTSVPSAQLFSQFEKARTRVRELNQEYRNQGVTLNQLRTAISQSSQSLRQNVSQIQTQRVELQQTTLQAQQARTGFSQILGASRSLVPSFSSLRDVLIGSGAALLTVTSNSNAAGAALRALRGQVLSVTTAYLSFFAIADQFQKVIIAVRELEAAQSRLNVVFEGNQDLGAKELSFVRREAQRLGQDFGILATQYSKFAVAAKGANVETSVTRQLFTSVAEAARVNKLSTDELNRTFTALSQILDKDKFQAEEVTQQLGEVIPGAANILAAALTKARGELVTTSDLFKEFKAGTVLADQNTLIAFADEISSRFSGQVPNALDSTTARLDSLNANLKNIRLTLAQGAFDSALSDFLESFNKQITDSEAQQFFAQIGQAAAGAVRSITLLTQNIDILTTALLAFKLNTFIGQFVRGEKAAGALRTALVAIPATAQAVAISLSGVFRSINVASLAAAIRSLLSIRLSFTAIAVTAGVAATGLRGFSAALLAARAAGGPLAKLLEILVSGLVAVGVALGIEELISYATALDELSESSLRYENSIQRVLSAADQSGQSIEALRSRLEGVSETQIKLDIDTFQQGIEESIQSIEELISSTEGLKATTEVVLQDLVVLYKSGAISAQEYLDRVNAIAQTDPGLDKIASSLRDNIRESEELNSKVRNLEDILDVLGGTTEEAADAVARLNGTLSHSSVAASSAGLDLETYSKSLEDLIGRTKKGRQELEKANIQETFDAGVAALTNTEGVITPKALAKIDQLTKARDQAVKEFEQSLNPERPRRTGGGASTAPGETEEQKQAKRQAEFNKKLQEESLDRQFQIKQAAIEDERVKAISEARQRAIVEAQRQGLQVSQQQIQLIEREAGLLFDSLNKRKGFEEAEKNLNALLETRKLIQERIEFLRESGDATSLQAADELAGKLVSVESQAKLAAEQAITLARALGDTNAVLNLENIILSLGQVKQQVAITAREINDSLAQGGATAIDNFSKSLVEGAGFFKSLGDAARQFFSDFLRQIAQAIAQQAILNALGAQGPGNSGGFGGFLSSAIGSLFHEGGVVGKSAVETRRVSADTWRNARRYHSGGIAGLKPDEVPAILRRNEEVLTREDPRHRANGGGSAMPEIKVVNTIDSGSFVSQGLNAKEGQQSLMNFIRANKTQVKAILG